MDDEELAAIEERSSYKLGSDPPGTPWRPDADIVALIAEVRRLRKNRDAIMRVLKNVRSMRRGSDDR